MIERWMRWIHFPVENPLLTMSIVVLLTFVLLGQD